MTLGSIRRAVETLRKCLAQKAAEAIMTNTDKVHKVPVSRGGDTREYIDAMDSIVKPEQPVWCEWCGVWYMSEPLCDHDPA